MTILNTDVVISPSNIKLGEVASVFQLIHKVGDEREGVGITSGVFIEVLIVLTGAEFPSFFLTKKKGDA